jgi:hypothetical protein
VRKCRMTRTEQGGLLALASLVVLYAIGRLFLG